MGIITFGGEHPHINKQGSSWLFAFAIIIGGEGERRRRPQKQTSQCVCTSTDALSALMNVAPFSGDSVLRFRQVPSLFWIFHPEKAGLGLVIHATPRGTSRKALRPWNTKVINSGIGTWTHEMSKRNEGLTICPKSNRASASFDRAYQ